MKSITQVVQNLIKPYIDSHNRAAEAIIAPVETDATSASDDYAIGKQLILNNVLYDVIAPITAGDALVVNTNIKAANNVSSDIDALTKKLEDEAATRSAMGAKNRLPITLASLKQTATAGTWANNVYTENGIDFTINTDASDYVTSIVVSGTASGVASINLLGTGAEYAANDFAGMILTGCPSGGGNDNYRTVVFIGDSQDGTGHTTQYEDGTGVTIGTNAYIRIYLRIASGTNLTTPITFYPMIRLASDTDSTYQPYAMTNRELTAENQTLTNETYNVNDTAITEVASDDLLPIYDTSATGKKKIAVSNFIGGLVSNPNLLDNPFFTVNQRGQSSYSGLNITTFDRWAIYGGATGSITVEAATKGVNVTVSSDAGDNQFTQRCILDDLAGKTITVSVDINGKIYSASGIVPNRDSNWNTVAYRLTDEGISFAFNTAPISSTFGYTVLVRCPKDGNAYNIRAVKLELGSVSTLAQDTAPNYATELLKCQRYFYKTLQFDHNGGIVSPNSCLAVSASRLQGIKFPVQMRTNPTVTVINATKLDDPTAISGVAAQWIIKDGVSYFSISNATVGELYCVDFEASADL